MRYAAYTGEVEMDGFDWDYWLKVAGGVSVGLAALSGVWTVVKKAVGKVWEIISGAADGWILRLTDSQRKATEQVTGQLHALTAEVQRLGNELRSVGSEVGALKASDSRQTVEISELKSSVQDIRDRLNAGHVP